MIEAFLDSGVNCMHPCEPAAGMDIVKIREKWGKRLMLVGGLDKFCVTRGKAEIQQELEYKIPAMMKSGGGCILSLDHRVPAETTLENYHYYIRKAWEIISANE